MSLIPGLFEMARGENSIGQFKFLESSKVTGRRLGRSSAACQVMLLGGCTSWSILVGTHSRMDIMRSAAASSSGGRE